MRRLMGIGAADGIVEGNAYVLDRRRIRVPKRHLDDGDIEPECDRFVKAVAEAEHQLKRVQDRLAEMGEATLILDAHRLIVTDPYLVSRALDLIREQQTNAEWALQQVVREISEVFNKVDDRYFKERRTDVDFGARHLLIALTNGDPDGYSMPGNSIVLAHDLSPADVARLHRAGIRAILTEVGGQTSHSIIMARSFGMCAIVGLRKATDIICTGDPLCVDGDKGEVVVHPDTKTRTAFHSRFTQREERMARLATRQDLPATTRDNVQIRLLANVGMIDEIPAALSKGVDGIGLYRTELVYLNRPTLPSEEDHYVDAYRMFEACGDVPVTVRTCDLEADRLPQPERFAAEPNPALGLRGLRYGLRRPQALTPQIMGVLRAANGRPLRLMFPMISSLVEFRAAKQLVNECIEDLKSPPSELSLGVLVETPAAAMIADDLAREVDFLAVGTNDMIQYTLAVDRLNDRVADLYRPLHPAVLRLIRRVVQAATQYNKPISVCGEMAGDPRFTLLLVGLGFRELSMGLRSVASIRRIIRAMSLPEAENLVQRVFRLMTAEQITDELKEAHSRLFPGGLAVVPTTELHLGPRPE